MRILFYVSGHGFGHGLRTGEVIKSLLRSAPSVDVFVRTSAPPGRLSSVPPGVPILDADIDVSVSESADALEVDIPATVGRLADLRRDADRKVEDEVRWVRSQAIDLVVADVPFLAGVIAARAERPCVGISNFTWHWILQPFLDDSGHRDLLDWMADGYARMTSFWRLPFSHPADLKMFREILPTPLIAAADMPARDAARSLLGLGAEDRVLLIGFRGHLPCAAVQQAARSMDMTFLTTEAAHAIGGDARTRVLKPNPMGFATAFAACDAVLGKPGYGLIAACCAGKHRLLYAPRTGFREDQITCQEARRYTCLDTIPVEDLYTGRWRSHLERLFAQDLPTEIIETNGATVCAERLLNLAR